MISDLTIKGGEHRYDEITALRGFSILTIVIMHLMQTWMIFYLKNY